MTQRKNSKPKMEFDSIDRISELPDSVIHTILTMLPRKDAVRTSVLSKCWNRIWETFPNLVFDQFTYTNVPTYTAKLGPEFRTPESTQKVGNFLDIVKRSVLRSTLCGVVATRFYLKTAIIDPELCPKLNECFQLALRSHAPRIDISNTPPGDVVLPEIAIVSDQFQYPSLRSLLLFGVCLSEKSIGDIFLSCPNIHSLRLMRITGLEKLDIHKLDMLDDLFIMSVDPLSVNIVDAPNLRSIHFTCLMPEISCTLDLTSCWFLRNLSLQAIDITDEWLRSLITRCPLLEDLGILDCKMLRKVTISSKNLTCLALLECNEIEAVEIDAPALSSFKHQAETFPRLSLKSVPAHLEFVHTLTLRLPVDTSRFVNLRKFLAIYTLPYSLTVIVNPSEVVFDCEELAQVVVPPAFQLEHLKLDIRFEDPSFNEPALIDGLLWSCHPKTISVFLKFSTMPHSFITVLAESLLEMETNPTCCDSSQVKCWRHDLKLATAQFFEESGEDSPVICFELEWDNDSIW